MKTTVIIIIISGVLIFLGISLASWVGKVMSSNTNDVIQNKTHIQLNYNSSTDTIISDSNYYKKLSIDSNGLIKWSLISMDSVNNFVIQEYRWGKWLLIDSVKNQKKLDYKYQTDISCGLYKIRILSKGQNEYYSNGINYSSHDYIKSFCTHNTKKFSFSRKTRFEIYDDEGNKLYEGCDKNFDYSSLNLKKGIYYINYGNTTETFVVRK